MEAEKFLEELSQLTNKYNIKIDACGCCSSPWLVEQIEKGKYVMSDRCDNLEFEEEQE